MTKICTNCHNEYALTHFHIQKRGRYGVTAECRPCLNTKRLTRLRAKPDYRKKQATDKANWRNKNKEKADAYVKSYYHRNKEWIMEKRAARKKKHPEYARKSKLKYTYGITTGEFDSMKISQSSCCPICTKESRLLVIDHNHKTGKVRALLCRSCNQLLGQARDNPEILRNAALYLTFLGHENE